MAAPQVAVQTSADRVKNLVKIGPTTAILNLAINGSTYEELTKLKQKIENEYEQTAESKDLERQINEIRYEPSQLRTETNKLKKLNDNLDKLLENSKDETTVDDIVNTLDLSSFVKSGAPVSTRSKQLEKKLRDEVKRTENEIKKIKLLKDKKKALKDTFFKQQRDYNQSKKQEYQDWKESVKDEFGDTVGVLTKKAEKEGKSYDYDNLFSLLEDKLESVSDPVKHQSFSDRLMKGKLTSQCIRLARAPTVTKYLLNEAILSYTNGMIVEHKRECRRILDEQISNSNVESTENPSKCSLYNLSRVECTGPLHSLFNTGMLARLREEVSSSGFDPSQSEAYLELEELTLTPHGKTILADVNTHLTKLRKQSKKQYDFDKAACTALAGLVIDFGTRIGSVIKASLAMGTIRTIKANTFHGFLHPRFILAGEDYEEVRSTIDKLWDITSNKKSDKEE